ncbi:type II toxin-antitoxin system RelE/ParE family toxin [Rhizobium sp.]|jgi:toxin ParE1/3/4|uniref:type II toxin-antitoxin system RelE/ParE family toxin n=1 Tax=Rhizobium sp. TaxID=391 RepID=UPI000DB97E77
MGYRLSRQAAHDLRTIHATGLRLFGKAQADSYHRHLGDIFEILADNPKLARLRKEITPPVRIHPCGAHLIVYHELGDGGILIIRVRHGHENWQA